jgi:RNA polymerase sigma factor (sigma-70 family)
MLGTIERALPPPSVNGTMDFEQLFVTEYRRVVAIAQRVLGNGGEAEDVAQEVFYAFYRQHSPSVPFARGWLCAAAAHAALNVARGRRRRQRREITEAIANERRREHTELDLDPEASVEREELRREVRELLTRLPERQALALIMRHSDLSYVEVAAAIGCPVSQVGTMLRRAEEALRKEINRASRA